MAEVEGEHKLGEDEEGKTPDEAGKTPDEEGKTPDEAGKTPDEGDENQTTGSKLAVKALERVSVITTAISELPSLVSTAATIPRESKDYNQEYAKIRQQQDALSNLISFSLQKVQRLRK